MSDLFIIPSHPQSRSGFECMFIRASADGFDLVFQHVTIIGDDFTTEEDVLLSAATPHPLVAAFRTGAVWELPNAHRQR